MYHRGNILIENNCQINNQIVCKYHGRRFNCKGKFISMPESNDMKNFSEMTIYKSIAVNKWHQFIFVPLSQLSTLTN